jgi:hypothetical protein
MITQAHFLRKKDEEKSAIDAPNEICRECLKWAEFQETCRVFWLGKTFCTMRVTTKDDWDAEHNLLTR